MIKRFLIVLALLLMVGGPASNAALAGPPWPAEVVQIRDGDLCWFTWFDEDLNFIEMTGPGMWEVQYINGRAQWNCHTTINFNDPGIASLDQVCDLFEELGLTDYCKGNGSFVWTTSTQPIPLECWHLDNVTPAYKATWVTTANGNTNINCHFDYTP